MWMLLITFFMGMFVYVNTLYYSMVLLAIVLVLMYLLVSNLMLHSLTMLLFIMVYVGAMMILIGYICAISPNLILISSHLNSKLLITVVSLFFLFLPMNLTPVFKNSFVPMVDYFYTYSGGLVFSVLIFMLFLTLLMVTSQYLTPRGPFRSVVL